MLYALGQANFLSDRSFEPYMPMADLCAHFGVSPSTAGNKAKLVRDMLGINRFDHRWMLPSLIDRSSAAWMIMVDGLPVDARYLPREIQEAAFQKGLIPYVPADEE